MSALIALAAEIGAPLVRSILANRVGAGNARLAEQVIGAIAERSGVAPDLLESFAQENPQVVSEAVAEVERMAPEVMALYLAETEAREAILLAEVAKGGWQAAWRPGWMYLLGLLWLWQVMILHALNAVFKIALPMMPWEYLMGLSALVWGIYSGGHTVKEVAKTWKRGG